MEQKFSSHYDYMVFVWKRILSHQNIGILEKSLKVRWRAISLREHYLDLDPPVHSGTFGKRTLLVIIVQINSKLNDRVVLILCLSCCALDMFLEFLTRTAKKSLTMKLASPFLGKSFKSVRNQSRHSECGQWALF